MTNAWDYEPNDMSSDILLSSAPLNLLKENIKAQFNDPTQHRKKDFITTFLNLYHFSINNEEELDLDDEEMDNLTELRDDFYSFMQDMFREYLNIGFVNFDDMAIEDQDNLIHFVYRFFLMNIKRNFVTYVLNYIDKNDFSNYIDEDKNDVTTISLRAEIDNEEDIAVLANLYTIVNDILNGIDDCEDFLSSCDNDSTLETRIVTDAYNDDKITGNFISAYVEMVDYDLKSEIESKVRNKILKKHKKK